MESIISLDESVNAKVVYSRTLHKPLELLIQMTIDHQKYDLDDNGHNIL